MSKSPNKSRTLSKAERDLITFQRVKNMSGFIDHIDKKLEFISEDLNLLLALQIAEPAMKEEMIQNLRQAGIEAQQIAEESAKEEINGLNE